jgi:hypothetical protein
VIMSSKEIPMFNSELISVRALIMLTYFTSILHFLLFFKI